MSGKLERVDRSALGGRATLKEVTVTFGPPELRPIHLMLVVPNHRQGPAPVVLGMNYFGNHTLVRDPAISLSTNWMPERGAGVVNNLSTEASRGTWADIWRIDYLIGRGYALATFYNGDIDPDRPDARAPDLFPQARSQFDCGTIAAWAWGLSRAVDYLVTDSEVDPQRIAVTGHSRQGKAALFAAALDERIALALPHQAGSGGSAPSRTHVKPDVSSRRTDAPYPLKAPETVTQINDQFPHWFNARFKEFNDRPERLPFDQHCLVALCARVRCCSPTDATTPGSIPMGSSRYCARPPPCIACWAPGILRPRILPRWPADRQHARLLPALRRPFAQTRGLEGLSRFRGQASGRSCGAHKCGPAPRDFIWPAPSRGGPCGQGSTG